MFSDYIQNGLSAHEHALRKGGSLIREAVYAPVYAPSFWDEIDDLDYGPYIPDAAIY